jgi:integrase
LNLSEESLKLLNASCADSTWKQYNYVIQSYVKFCEPLNQSPWNPSLDVIIKFLTYLFSEGKSYVTINTARSALSTSLGSVDGLKIGSHPIITRLLKGVSRLRPPRCKYDNTWDPKLVLDLLSSWAVNEELDLSKLSLKVTALLALCSAQRVQTLCSIEVDEISISDTELIINISKRLKTTKPGSGLQIRMKRFSDLKLCPVECLQNYINRTNRLRLDKQLLISTRSPFKAVSSQTASNWLKKVLKLAKVDVNKFSGHSFRHASTSKAHSLGVSIDSIFKAAGWTSASKVFAKYYCKQIDDNSDFSNAILSGNNKAGLSL